MIPEIGHFALCLALAISILLSVLPLLGVNRGIAAWMNLSGTLSHLQAVLVAISFACLANAFLKDDFSVVLVAQHSNTLLPDWYKLSAVWGNHEGSLLLWLLILSLWTAAVAAFSKALTLVMKALVLSVMGMISVGFELFIVLTSNPFLRSLPNVPAEGRDLNPLLQDIGLILHPPMLYIGYVGFSVAFAFAIAALASGRLDSAWARWSRPWTTAAWIFLTLGIALGSWWAYYELGWGGWWFWDPVENASFMPWLAGTALLHSLSVTEKRGLFKSWTVLLAICTFSLSLLGTFLVRSGVLTSVHAFATDPARGVFILAFLGVVVGASLTLYAFRAPSVSERSAFALLSRESSLLWNNLILFVAMLTVLVGTLYPLIISALDMGRMSVGPPYFNLTFVPLMVMLVLVMGVGPLLNWRSDSKGRLAMLLPPVLASVVLACVFPFAYAGEWHIGAALTIAIASWLVLTLLVGLRERLRQRGSLSKIGASYYGMLVAHLGMAVTIIGAGLTSIYTQERDVRMQVGAQYELAGYEFSFMGVSSVDGPNYQAQQAVFKVRRGSAQWLLEAEKRRYQSQMGNVMTEAGIDPGLWRDLYVSLGEVLDDGSWAVRVHVKPFVRWIWLGAIFMAIGGILTTADRRYRARARSGAVVESTTATVSP